MKNHDKYTNAFIAQAMQGYYDWTYCDKEGIDARKDRGEKSKLLRDRRRKLNEIWRWTPRRVQKLEALNRYLRKLEDDVFDYHVKLERKVIQEIRNQIGFINDYNIDIEVNLWSPKKYKKLKIEEFDGDPFFTLSFPLHIPTLGKGFKKEWEESLDFRNTNWNEVALGDPNHPVSHQHHCYFLHDLYDHYPLAWSDIVEIESVWINIKVNYQNLSEFGKTSSEF